MNRQLVFLFVVSLLLSCTSSNQSNGPQVGEDNYKANCTACHGFDGKLKSGGASDLTLTALNTAEIKTIILEGRGNMPSFKPLLTDEEALAVANFVEKFKQSDDR